MGKVVIKKLTQEEINEKGIPSWPIWEKEVSTFPWTYDGDEECLILDGEFEVETETATYHIKAGDFVIFREGLTCIWRIKQAVRKHYNFR